MRILRIVDRDTGKIVPFTTTPTRRSKMEPQEQRARATMRRVARQNHRGVQGFLEGTAAALLREFFRRLS
jgi:hypothetical protein